MDNSTVGPSYLWVPHPENISKIFGGKKLQKVQKAKFGFAKHQQLCT